MVLAELSEREQRVLEAVIEYYVETAQPAGSQELSRRYALGVSAATIRNTMSDLEEKGFLYHPHTSAGRIPTDAAYRFYVNSVIPEEPSELPPSSDQQQLAAEILPPGGSLPAREAILRRAAHSLGLLARELGVALGPAYSEDSTLDYEANVVLGRPSILAEQPEFASANRLRELVLLTEMRENLGELLRRRMGAIPGVSGVSVTIGSENEDPSFSSFTIVTAQYSAGDLSGVIGVIGPTRMPYPRVISLVTHTSRLVSGLLH